MEVLVEAARRKGSALVVGLDPAPGLLPEALSSLAQTEAVREFCLGILEAVEPFAAAVKPQAAYFERLGVGGASVYAEVVREAKRVGLPVISDVKRADIGFTAAAYAEAHLSAFGADCVTVNPYLGSDAVAPFLEEVRRQERGGGVFVLVATSNPSSATFQEATEPPVYEIAARLVSKLGRITASGYPDAGAVVGATRPEVGARVRRLLPDTLFLVPGYGAQGGGSRHLRALLDRRGGGILVNSSRGVIAPYRKGNSGVPEDFQRAAASAAESARDELRGAGVGFG